MATILFLPSHLVADVLCELDLCFLPAALLSHRIFWIAFQETPSILVDMLRRRIPANLLHLSIGALLSKKSVREPYGVDAGAWLTQYYDRPLDLLRNHSHLTLSQALQVQELHQIVMELSEMFSAYTLRRLHNLTRRDPPPRGPSPDEEYRICRALYRIQIFRNLFLDYPILSESRTPHKNLSHNPSGNIFLLQPPPPEIDIAEKALFFDRHSPWVNEQLLCVYDYLEDHLIAACQDYSINGFKWGDNLTNWLENHALGFEQDRYVSNSIKHLPTEPGSNTTINLKLSLGLAKVLKLLKAPKQGNYHEFKVPNIKHVCESDLGDDLIQFYKNLAPLPSRGYWGKDDIDLLSRCRHEADFADSDDRPRLLWARAHYDSSGEPNQFHLGAHAFSLRGYTYRLRFLGYVIWDNIRVSEEVCVKNLTHAYYRCGFMTNLRLERYRSILEELP